MATPDRELILARLETVLMAVPGALAFKRNEPIVDDGNLPAIMLLDGDEIADAEDHSNGRPARTRARVAMTPEIYLITNEPPGRVGPVANRMLHRIVNRVMSDSTLLGLCVDGQIRYDGMQTGLALGRSLAGELGIQFTFYRLHDPAYDPPEESTEGPTS